jgi:hypothetical protein
MQFNHVANRLDARHFETVVEMLKAKLRFFELRRTERAIVLSTSDEWEVLNLPAIAEADEDIPISATKVHCRKAGEALSPAREPISVLEI